MDLATAARDVDGRVRGDNRRFARVVSDTRALQADDLFVALSGERFDGHDFVSQAMSAGAAGSLNSLRMLPIQPNSRPMRKPPCRML